MIAVLTGDIINSDAYPASEWIGILKTQFSKWGKTPIDWEIYRGDEFQLKTSADNALWMAIQLKALIKSVKGLDVRMAIGIGTESFKGTSVSESNGTAYQNSGRTFENLKVSKVNLAISTGDIKKDKSLNLMLKLALNFMDDWTPVSAEIIAIALANPELAQQEIAEQLHIQQSAVSQRQKRARYQLVLELLHYYQKLNFT